MKQQAAAGRSLHATRPGKDRGFEEFSACCVKQLIPDLGEAAHRAARVGTLWRT
jgi:hypothetical protein